MNIWFIYWLRILSTAAVTLTVHLFVFFSLTSLRSTIILNSYCFCRCAVAVHADDVTRAILSL